MILDFLIIAEIHDGHQVYLWQSNRHLEKTESRKHFYIKETEIYVKGDHPGSQVRNTNNRTEMNAKEILGHLSKCHLCSFFTALLHSLKRLFSFTCGVIYKPLVYPLFSSNCVGFLPRPKEKHLMPKRFFTTTTHRSYER